jgi:hypothetical protein
MASESKPARSLAILLIVTALVTALYWLNYFTGGDVKTVDARWYTAFEDAFPVADGWLAVTSLLAGIGLWHRARWAGAMCLLAGSALLYLAGMDITFDVENGLYARVPASPQMQFELLINLWSLGLGIWSVAAGWIRTVPSPSGTDLQN